jgi:hypothetical protein
MPGKKSVTSEMQFNFIVNVLMGFAIFFLLYVVFRLLFVYFEGAELSATIGAGAITLGALLSNKE